MAGNLDEHVLYIATWIENLTDEAIPLQACFGSDDDGQVWLDDQLLHNAAACRGRADCQDVIDFDLPPGVHVIKIGVWEQGGGWGARLQLNDPLDLLPIVDTVGGRFDPGLFASPLSSDIAFHGRNKPAEFVDPDSECDEVELCFPISELICTVDGDGSVELSWFNGEGCSEDIEILVNGQVVDTIPADSESYTLSADDRGFAASVSVNNGALQGPVSCTLAEVQDFLLGSDLTDIDDDGLEDLYFPPDDLGGFDGEFFSSDEPGFGGGEFAFNVFDNVVGGGNDKWCCGTTFPQIVGVDFTNSTGEEYLLTHFTVSSANDTPGRDPRVWRIEGSNDGEEWDVIFEQNDPSASLWGDVRLQTLLFEEGIHYPVQETAYAMFRMVTEQTGLIGGAFFQVAEIEFFGEPGDGAREICTNGTDDDGDGDVDCADSDCAGNAACGGRFNRGDADASGTVNITDAIFLLNFLFLGGQGPACADSGDVDDSGTINITDGINLLNFLFLGGNPPSAPSGECGGDPTADDLTCDESHAAGECAQ